MKVEINNLWLNSDKHDIISITEGTLTFRQNFGDAMRAYFAAWFLDNDSKPLDLEYQAELEDGTCTTGKLLQCFVAEMSEYHSPEFYVVIRYAFQAERIRRVEMPKPSPFKS